MSSKDEKQFFTRRNFLKGAAAGTAVVGAGVIAGCGKSEDAASIAPKSAEAAPAAEAAPEAAQAAARETMKGGLPKPDFMIAPEPIADDQIAETVEADVVVVGAGTAGIMAASNAQQAGAQTALVHNTKMYLVHGWNVGALNTEQMLANGVKIDTQEAIYAHMHTQGFWPSYEVVKLWAEKSADAIKYVDDILAEAGEPIAYNVPEWSSDYPNTMRYGTNHWYEQGDVSKIMGTVLKKAEEDGLQVYYENPAVQLVREDDGRVTGVISQTPDGKYNKFIAKKGVVLATGGFCSDPEMMNYYLPWAADLPNARNPQVFTGDGQKMALWAGAAMQPGPQAIMIHYDPVMGADSPFLFVNATGKRYMNEDTGFEHIVNAECAQPGQFRWQILDGKYDEDRKQFYSTGNGITLLPDGKVTVEPFKEPIIEPAEAAGILVQADTLEELAELMEVPVDAFVATIERYNELSELGEDPDFGKNSDFLTTVSEAPFYAIKRMPLILATVSGLDINGKLQVKDTEGNVIPGLYAAGGASGNFYSVDYPMVLNSVSNGRAYTFGMLAGRFAAEETA